MQPKHHYHPAASVKPEAKPGSLHPDGSTSGVEVRWIIKMTERHTSSVMATNHQEALEKAAAQGYAGDHELVSITAKRSRM